MDWATCYQRELLLATYNSPILVNKVRQLKLRPKKATNTGKLFQKFRRFVFGYLICTAKIRPIRPQLKTEFNESKAQLFLNFKT